MKVKLIVSSMTTSITTISYEQLVSIYINPDEMNIHKGYCDTVPNFIKNYRIDALDVSERYINGLATKAELDKAVIIVRDASKATTRAFNEFFECKAIRDDAIAHISNAQIDYLLDLFERGANFD
jgi:hypothetical protein